MIFEKEKRWILEEKYQNKKEKDLSEKEKKSFKNDIKKLQNNEPLAYIIGNMPFLDCKIDLEFKPLIPRVETEFWVNDFIKNDLKNIFQKKWDFATQNPTKIKKNEKIEILDIFSGSGCIGISILKEIEKFKNKENYENRKKNIFFSVDFSEINENFIRQIKKNIKINLKTGDFGGKMAAPFFHQNHSATLKTKEKKIKNWKIFKSDVFKNLPQKKWDFILANPPYIPKNKEIDNSVKDFEDYNSLFAEDNGLYFVKKIIKEGLKKLKKNGKIFIEFDETSRDEIENFLKNNFIKNYHFKKDQYNNWRVLVVCN